MPPDARLVEIVHAGAPDANDHTLVTTSEAPAKASAALKKGGFDVILLDLGLPDANGLDLVQ